MAMVVIVKVQVYTKTCVNVNEVNIPNNTGMSWKSTHPHKIQVSTEIMNLIFEPNCVNIKEELLWYAEKPQYVEHPHKTLVCRRKALIIKYLNFWHIFQISLWNKVLI